MTGRERIEQAPEAIGLNLNPVRKYIKETHRQLVAYLQQHKES
jgi:hypothetical protein